METAMTHPACCKDPDNCDLTYREHLINFGLSATAIPTRAVTRTKSEVPGVTVPDEPTTQTIIREKRWERDLPAYKRLRAEGLEPRAVNGAAARERMAETVYDATQRPMSIDYNDPK
jgi:hypothetical protein